METKVENLKEHYIMKQRILLVGILMIIFVLRGFSQSMDTSGSIQYQFNKKVEIPVSLALWAYDFYGFDYLSGTKGLSESEVNSLDVNDIWFFDRWVSKQDPSYRESAHNTSDFFLNVSVILPAILGLDKKVREQWLDIGLMYAELHGLNSSLYITAATFINRNRPIVYNSEADMGERTYNGTRNSFYSGHVSTAACATFFAAKVYTDLHPELGNKKYLFYAAAVIPPALVGYFRLRAQKHFLSDVLTGFAVGSTLGILVPQLHHVKIKNNDLSFMPVLGKVSGFNLRYRIN